MLMERQAARAKERAARLEEKVVTPPPNRTAEEWEQMSRDYRYTAHQRERDYLRAILNEHDFCISDLAFVFQEREMLQGLFESKEMRPIYFTAARELMKKVEEEHFGVPLVLYLYYDLNLKFEKILSITRAASMKYNKQTDLYESKVLLYDPDRKSNVVYVPRLAPPRNKYEPIIKSFEESLGIQSADNGRLAFKPLKLLLEQILMQDPKLGKMPPLEEFLDGKTKLYLPLQFDATGYGSLQINTIGVSNPYLAESASNFRPFGIGRCADDKSGTSKLIGPDNQKLLDELFDLQRAGKCYECELDGKKVKLDIKPVVITDVSALRHTEHGACSGWCGCSRDRALREVPTKPPSIEAMYEMLPDCKELMHEERVIFGHNTLPGEDKPRPCPAPGCTFAHDPRTALAQQKEMLAKEAALAADTTKAGKQRFSKWRMDHAHGHFNVQPGAYGMPMLKHDMKDQILDSLHLGKLNLPKIPWKHGVKNNSSDDAREDISRFLQEKKHPLDMRRKEDNRNAAQKWYTGEKWQTFVKGQRGSLGGPRMIAEIMMYIAKDLEQRGVSSGDGLPPKDWSGGSGAGRGAAGRGAAGRGAAGRGAAGGRGRGRGGFMSRLASGSGSEGDGAAADGAGAAAGAAGAAMEPEDNVNERASHGRGTRSPYMHMYVHTDPRHTTIPCKRKQKKRSVSSVFTVHCRSIVPKFRNDKSCYYDCPHPRAL